MKKLFALCVFVFFGFSASNSIENKDIRCEIKQVSKGNSFACPYLNKIHSKIDLTKESKGKVSCPYINSLKSNKTEKTECPFIQKQEELRYKENKKRVLETINLS